LAHAVGACASSIRLTPFVRPCERGSTMTIVLVMILAALIALFIMMTVGLVIVQRRPRADRRRRRRRAHLPVGDDGTRSSKRLS
jgi:hypothetical protein